MLHRISFRWIITLLPKKCFHTNSRLEWQFSKFPELDTDFLCNQKNLAQIEFNIKSRKGVGDIGLVNEIKKKLESSNSDNLREQFYQELTRIPNQTHPDVLSYGDKPKVVKLVNDKKQFPFTPKEFHQLTKKQNLVRTEHLGNVCGNRSYYILGDMARFEQALVNYFLENLLKCNFELISVPDILPRHVIESCGMDTRGERNQVYKLDPNHHENDMCLSGTSEIALAGYMSNKTFEEKELPKKLVAVSRCYRAEASSVAEERGIFRVHEFTKVEMFMVTTPNHSDSSLEELRTIQEKNFESLGLHFHVLDMPPHELGAQAYRKYDIEAWMPGRQMYGEISSCSNCTDYQSRRLGIKYRSQDGALSFAHTLNGTACAIPRLLIALIETEQDENDNIHIPTVLQKYVDNKTVIDRQKRIPILQLIKNKKKL